ncbi:LytR/AlgR family response regulator transcription factor [Reichenbachiella versicolor]|uniref:LytR/AlgR family response regulator transcription factor n=1 Tax=Reichenbachiella versicolor TaxID=1821036 RepID=UPI000D6E5C31|nr:LytTR family DNA-binding domain-containing protein [Reichenbachiella versicolor]
MTINCLIIDDEKLARDYLKNYVDKVPQLHLLDSFNSPLKAMDLIKSGKVDLVFLDIQMPGLTGVEFVKSLKAVPEIIFTTAYQEYALEGFNLNVVDYLLKPFSFERFFQAVNKVIDKFENQKEQPLLPIESQASIQQTYLTVKADRRLYKINFDDLIYVEGQKAYVTFHTNAKKKVMALLSLKELEESLPSDQFIRIHKSYIVSIQDITGLEGNMLEVGELRLPVGSSYRSEVMNMFGVS